MSLVLPRGVLSISIDLEMDVLRGGLDQQRSLEEVTGRLIRLLEKYNIPATCAVADPAVSAATDRLLVAAAGHEIAILGDQTWVGRTAGRTRFARELGRRVGGARAAGIAVSSLVVRDAELEDHLDLLVKQGVTAVRTAYAPTGSWRRQLPQPRSLRFGVWDLPAAARLPGASRWIPGGGELGLCKRLIDRAVRERDVCHVIVEGLLMATRGAAGLRTFEKVLRHADRLRAQDSLAIETMSLIAARFSGDRQAAPAHSILRPAA